MPPELATLALVYAALLGAAVGSFLNVVIARLPSGLSLVRPRSRCPKCESAIAWYDNVPLVSWLVLAGKCRACRAPISPRYPLVEALTAVLFVAVWLRFGWSWELALWLPLTAMLLAITFLDIDHFWVPDVITLPAGVLALAYAFVPGGLPPMVALLGLLPAGLLWATAWVFEKLLKREGMGLGDVKLLAVLGLAVGLADALTLLFLAAAQGAIIGGIVVALGGHRRVEPAPEHDDGWQPHPRAIPFGPFLVLGALEVVLVPDLFATLPQHFIEWLARVVH